MSHEPKPPHDDNDEREWVLQERALQAERLSLDARGDEDLLRYRAVARALRQAPPENLPADFAQQVAMQASRRSTASVTFELLASLVLLGTLLAMLLGLIVKYGDTWMQATHTLAPLHAWMTPWTLALVAGIALPALLDGVAHARKPRQR